MKIYITVEEGEFKVEKVLEVTQDSVSDHNKYGVIIEEMVDSLVDMYNEPVDFYEAESNLGLNEDAPIIEALKKGAKVGEPLQTEIL